MSKENNLEQNKIKYVALGDSISEGYSEYFQFGNAGEMKNGEISGTSWPAFLARNLRAINPKWLESYYNFALSSSRPEDWNYFLGVDDKKYKYAHSAKKIEFIKELNKNKLNPYPNRMKKYFNNFAQNNANDFKFLIQKIKEANLITFNIGANSVLPKIPYKNLMEVIVENDIKNVYEIKDSIDKVTSSVANDVENMIEKLKELNPNAKIFCIGYISPSNPLFETINNTFSKFKEIIGTPLCVYFIEKLNETLKISSLLRDIFFIDVFNNKYWCENAQMLNEIFYDIHPSVKGYKKIAQDVLLKMLIPSHFLEKNIDRINSIIPTFNKEYVKKDLYCFQPIINFKNSSSYEQIIDLIYGHNNQILEENSKYENEAKNLVQHFFIEKSINNKDFSASTLIEIKRTLQSFISLLGIEVDKKILFEIEKLTSKKEFLNFLLDSRILSKIFWDIQHDLLIEYDKKTFKNYEDFTEIVIKNVFDIDNLLFYIKIFVIYFAQGNKVKSKELFRLFSKIVGLCLKNNKFKKSVFDFSLIIINSFAKRINLKINRSIFIQALRKIELSSKIEQLLNELYDFTILNLDKIKKIKDSKRLFELYFLNDYKALNIFELFYKLVQDDDEISIKITQTFIDKLSFSNLTANEEQKISNFIHVVTKIVNSNKMIKNAILQFLVQLVIFSKKEIHFQDIVEFLVSLDKKTFWSKLESINFSKMPLHDLDTIVDFVNLIWDHYGTNSNFYQDFKKINNPKAILNGKTEKPNLIKLFITLDKFLYLISPMQMLFNRLYHQYLETKDKTKEIDKDNKYYKFMFRVLVLLLLTSYSSFQKNITTNVFWNSSPIMNIAPSIVSTIFRFTTPKNEHFKAKGFFFIKMMGEENNPNLQNKYNEKTYKQNQLLWYIYSFEQNPRDKFTNKFKIDIVLNSLKKGSWFVEEKK